MQRRDHIAQRGRAERSHHPDAAWLYGQRAFARRVEQPFRFQLGFQAQELFEQGPLPGRLEAVDDELQITAGPIDVELAQRLDHLPIARRKVQLVRRAAEQGAAHLANIVLE
ncbi:hypothetical protein D9M68_891610 [compost metagenome]